MPRRRYLSPGFFTGDLAPRVAPQARLLLLGCWTLADDQGLLRWEAPWLRESVFPYDPEVGETDVAAWMNQLVATDTVVAYRGGKQRIPCGYLVGFERDHRTARPKPSRLPAPVWSSPAVQHGYLTRDGFCCHLCTGPILTATEEAAAAAAATGFDLGAALDRVEVAGAEGRGVYPSNVACAHVACVALRAARPVAEARQDLQIMQVGQMAHRVHEQWAAAAAAASADSRSALVASEATAVGATGDLPKAGAEAGAGGSDAASVTGVGIGRSATVVEGSSGAVLTPDLGSAALRESGSAGLTTNSVSRAVPGSSACSEPEVSTEEGPLTCDFTDSVATHDRFSESVVSLSGVLREDSPTEKEKEREMEGEKEPLSASRSNSAAGGAATTPPNAPTDLEISAFGAGQNEPADLPLSSPSTSPSTDGAADHTGPHPQNTSQPTTAHDTGQHSSRDTGDGSVHPDLSPADAVLAPSAPQDHPGGETVPTDDAQVSLFDVSADMVQAPTASAPCTEPDTWTPERKQQAHALLKPWWATHGTTWTQPYRLVFKAVMGALVKGVSEQRITDRLAKLAEDGEQVTAAALAPKRKEPATWTPDRKQQAHALLQPWWEVHQKGWPQGYGVVFGVIVAALANQVTPEEITRALNILGPERKPISGGTIAFALSRSSKQVAEETAYEALAASRSSDKYVQRTL